MGIKNKEAYYMKKFTINPTKGHKLVTAAQASADPRREALDILTKLQAAFALIEQCSDECFMRYMPDRIVEELDMNIRELHQNIQR